MILLRFGDFLLSFSQQAIRHLKRHKIPFTGALKLVEVSDMQPRPGDPKFIRLRDSYPDVLTRRFEAAKLKLGEVLGQLVQAKSAPWGTVSLCWGKRQRWIQSSRFIDKGVWSNRKARGTGQFGISEVKR